MKFNTLVQYLMWKCFNSG